MKKILKVIVANIAAFLHIPLLIVSIPFKVIAIAHSIIIDLSTQFMAVLCVAFMLTGIIGTIASIPEVGLGYAIAYGLLFLILVGALLGIYMLAQQLLAGILEFFRKIYEGIYIVIIWVADNLYYFAENIVVERKNTGESTMACFGYYAACGVGKALVFIINLIIATKYIMIIADVGLGIYMFVQTFFQGDSYGIGEALFNVVIILVICGIIGVCLWGCFSYLDIWKDERDITYTILDVDDIDLEQKKAELESEKNEDAEKDSNLHVFSLESARQSYLEIIEQFAANAERMNQKDLIDLRKLGLYYSKMKENVNADSLLENQDDAFEKMSIQFYKVHNRLEKKLPRKDDANVEQGGESK